MTIALVILATLLALAAAGSAMGKLRRVPSLVESLHSVGVSDSMMRVLALLEILGALGLLVGIWIAPIGVAAAAGLTLYFLGAVIAHIRAKEFQGIAPAVVLFILALVTLWLEFARLS